jgi:DNA processing protein
MAKSVKARAPRESELVRGAREYPEQLGELDAPPVHLRVLGSFDSAAPMVSIVGTRRADPEAMAFAHALAGALAREGQTIVSGGAIGIDAAAHEGALAVGGATIAVLASGFRPAYPSRNAELFGRIATMGGGLISEMPDGTPPQDFRFLRRNELVAALGHSLVVVQAPRVSGASSTAAAASRLGRHVFSVPASPWDLRGEGCLELLKRGARICVSAAEVLSVCPPGRPFGGFSGAPAHFASDGINDLSDDEQQVLGLVGARPRHVDEIVRATGLAVERVQQVLLLLLLSGRVDERDGGRYVRAPRMR